MVLSQRRTARLDPFALSDGDVRNAPELALPKNGALMATGILYSDPGRAWLISINSTPPPVVAKSRRSAVPQFAAPIDADQILGRAFWVIFVVLTVAPESRNRSTIARPMPWAAPVTTAKRPLRSIVLPMSMPPLSCET
jgi:hypothetical protein